MDKHVQAGPSPIKTNKSGIIISKAERQRIVNMYKSISLSDPDKSIRQIRKMISDQLGVGERTIHKIIAIYNKTKTVAAPIPKRSRRSYIDQFGDFERNAVRTHVHQIWFRREIPTMDKIHQAVSTDDSLPDISRTNLYHLLKIMDFRYTKRSRNGAMTEKNEIVGWRRDYLASIKKYRDEGRHIYYLDETWVNAEKCALKTWVDTTIQSQRDAFHKGPTTGAVKGKRLIVLHIGSKDGFLPGGLLCLKSKKNTRDYRDKMNSETFREWMEGILPRLQPNSVIVMDNAAYHSVKVDNVPTSNTWKTDIIQWLESKGEVVDPHMVIPQLLLIVKRLKALHKPMYAIDELVKANNHTVLRLPQYHCELNPIELAWSSVKNHVRMHNTTYKLPDVKNLLIEGINRVDADMWKQFLKHTEEEEDKFYQIDFIIDDVLTAEMTNLTMTITRETSSDSD